MSEKKGLRALQNGSDIRGIAIPGVSGEANLLRTEAESLTQGFLRWLSEKTEKPVEDLTVAVGCDSRLSGPYLKQIILRFERSEPIADAKQLMMQMADDLTKQEGWARVAVHFDVDPC